jgi:hypothetical protein
LKGSFEYSFLNLSCSFIIIYSVELKKITG